MREIFLIDDDPDELFLAKLLIERRDPTMRLTTFLDAEEAESALRTRLSSGAPPPVVIAIDINMPRISGLEVLRRLKPLCAPHAVRVGILTGSINPADRAEAARVGADFFMVKPIDLERLTKLCEAADAPRAASA